MDAMEPILLTPRSNKKQSVDRQRQRSDGDSRSPTEVHRRQQPLRDVAKEDDEDVEEEVEDLEEEADDGLITESPQGRHGSVNSFLKFSIQNILQHAVNSEALVNQQKRVAAALQQSEVEAASAATASAADLKSKARFEAASCLPIW